MYVDNGIGPKAPAIPALPEASAAAVIAIAGGRSFVGTDRPEIASDGEGPERQVRLVDFGLESTTVTNARFAAFVTETGYVSEAEHFGWSAVFDNSAWQRPSEASPAHWWHKVEGACWWAPEGPGSSVEERMDHPVVQVSWHDAIAFARWAGGRLPTEAEWEHAARGGAQRRRFPWGEEEPGDRADQIHCNIWQGSFPAQNSALDGYMRTAPAGSFVPNALGLYNMAGNVWEWTSDAFRVRSMARQARQRNEAALRNQEKVLKGGSFLCHISYCYRYRIAARMALPPDSGASNVGFRLAYDHRKRPEPAK